MRRAAGSVVIVNANGETKRKGETKPLSKESEESKSAAALWVGSMIPSSCGAKNLMLELQLNPQTPQARILRPLGLQAVGCSSWLACLMFAPQQGWLQDLPDT